MGEIVPQSRFPILNPTKQRKVRLQMAAFSVAGLHEYCFPHSENGLFKTVRTVSDKKRKAVNYVKLCTELSYINNVGTSLNKLNKHKNT